MRAGNGWKYAKKGLNSEAQRLADEFLDLVQRGKNPAPEKFLKRYPAYREILAPIVEGAARLNRVMKRYCRMAGTKLPFPENP